MGRMDVFMENWVDKQHGKKELFTLSYSRDHAGQGASGMARRLCCQDEQQLSAPTHAQGHQEAYSGKESVMR